MANRNLYLFYSEKEFPLTKSTTQTRFRSPYNPISAERLYFPAVWLMLKGDYYRLDFSTIEVARAVLNGTIFFRLTLRQHTTKIIRHQEYLDAFEK